jgi:hypothetical protein
MKIEVLSVKEKRPDERLIFSFVDEDGRLGQCMPSLSFLHANSSFSVKPKDRLIVDDFIPDMITREATHLLLVPEFVQRISN